MKDPISVLGPRRAAVPVVLDSPHSGHDFPPDFDAAVSEFDLRQIEDMYVDALYQPATELGLPLLAAGFPRTYLDANRHQGDIDLELIDGGRWPHEHRPSGKQRIGQALIWRLLSDGRAIYRRKLSVAEVRGRIDRCHAPYHATLSALLADAVAQHGCVYHLNCHSMSSVGGVMSEGGEGMVRADFVLGDRDGSTCEPAFTEFVRSTLAAMGYSVAVNHPYKGVELVRAYSEPAAGRHSLQVEINKRLYMDEDTRERHAGFARLQGDLLQLLAALVDYARSQAQRQRS